MKANDIMKFMKKGFYKGKFFCKKHSSEIFMILGITAGGGAIVTAGIATYRATPKIQDAKKRIEDIRSADRAPEEVENLKKDVRKVKVETGVAVVKEYAIPAALSAVSLTSILTSHNIIKKRNVELAAAYTSLYTGFKDYRSRVVERFGEKVDKELKTGIVDTHTEVSEDGKSTEVSVVEEDPNLPSDYACYFDERSRSYNPIESYNRLFLKAQQKYATDKLISQGHLFLNEVYDMLDLPRTKVGAVVGWLYDATGKGKGDNYVDFRMTEVERKNSDGELVPVVALDFNVDGTILYDI